MRNGQDYLASIRDGRCVYLHGRRVDDVTAHPAFQGVTRTVAHLYDFAADPANEMQSASPDLDQPFNAAYMIPRTADDLRRRHTAIERWARQTNGLVGRGPDHVAGFLAGFASAPDVFARGGERFGENVTRWYRDLAMRDQYVAYVIIPPQIDRSTTAQNLEEKYLPVGVLRAEAAGMVVRGAQMLGTGAAIANYLFVSCIVPLRPGDEDYAISFILPMSTPGLKLYCRPPYAPDKPSVYDYPLSTRFDESDALVVFDDVLVPWENVFVYRNVELVRAQFFESAAHQLGNNQAQIRLATKMKFVIGVARRIAATTRIDTIPAVQEKLGDLASLAAIVEGMVLASEATAVSDRYGVVRPNPRFLYGAMGLQAEFYPRALHLLRELSGGGMIQVPSSVQDVISPETQADIRRYVRATGVPAEERIKLFKLAWDLVGSEFGGRHHQYEMFYAGGPNVAKGYAFRNYHFEEATELVERFMQTYDLGTPLVQE